MNHTGNCTDLLRQIGAYIEGDLPENICRELEAHMAACQNCRVVLNTTRRTIELYQDCEPESALPADVRQRLFARLDLDGLTQPPAG
jgi:anti-sigma factor (TIGR02949 family)